VAVVCVGGGGGAGAFVASLNNQAGAGGGGEAQHSSRKSMQTTLPPYHASHMPKTMLEFRHAGHTWLLAYLGFCDGHGSTLDSWLLPTPAAGGAYVYGVVRTTPGTTYRGFVGAGGYGAGNPGSASSFAK
jgi:hypothetical protein